MPDVATNPAVGVLCKFAICDTLPCDKPLDFESETLGLNENFLDPQGLRGTVARAASRVRAAGRNASGDVVLGAPTATELSYVLPYALGGTPTVSGTGKLYPMAEQLPTVAAQLERGASRFDYPSNKIDRLVITAAKGQAVRVTMSLLGLDEVDNPATTFPALALDNGQFFILEDSTAAVTIAGTTINCFEWELTINNAVQQRNVNSQTPTAVYRTDRVISQRFRVPWGDAETLYALAQGGVATSVTFTFGNMSFAVTAPKYQVPRRSPDVRGRDELINELNGMCRYSSTPGDEISVFLDNTP